MPYCRGFVFVDFVLLIHDFQAIGWLSTCAVTVLHIMNFALHYTACGYASVVLILA